MNYKMSLKLRKCHRSFYCHIQLGERRKESISGYTCIHEGRTAKSEIMSYGRWGQWQAIWSGKSPHRVSRPLRQPRSIWKSNALSLLTSQVLECESLGQVKEQDHKWLMSHLNDTLQSLHHVLAEESQENKWLSFTFQEPNRGDRQKVTVPIRLISQPLMLRSSLQREEKARKHTDRRKFEQSTWNPKYFFFLFVCKGNPLPIYRNVTKW